MNIFSNVMPSIGIQRLGELVVLQSQLLLIPILLATEKPSHPLIIFINYPVAAFYFWCELCSLPPPDTNLNLFFFSGRLMGTMMFFSLLETGGGFVNGFVWTGILTLQLKVCSSPPSSVDTSSMRCFVRVLCVGGRKQTQHSQYISGGWV